MLILIDFESFE